MTETAEEILDTRDSAVRATGFKSWLEYTADGDFLRLKEIVNAAPRTMGGGAKFKVDDWIGYIMEYYTEEAEELVDLLLRAQIEWRVDRDAGGDAAKALEIRVGSAHDFVDPTPSDMRTCRFIKGRGDPDARKCGLPVVPGTVRCRLHGGELVDAETRRAVLMTSYLQLVEATGVAVEALVSVAEHSRNDLARVAAAKEILDRAGLTPELQVSVKFESDGREEKLSALREKLDKMQRGLQERAIDAVAREVPNPT